MAGMLPGVEAARRRRFHQKSNLSYGSSEIYISGYGGGSSFSRRPSFCLYASSHEFHLSSNSSNMQRNPTRQTECDESRLCAEAREAKKRLDERLQPQWRSETTKRTSKIGDRRLRSLQDRPVIQVDSQAGEVPKLKKSGSKRLNWLKLSWKLSEQEECAVCLEQLKAAESLMQLVCGHRFHAKCLTPWLAANAHCPCCRLKIPPTSKHTIL